MPIPLDSPAPVAMSAPAPTARAPLRIDLLNLTPARPCASASSDEVVVCARRAPDDDRLQPLPEFTPTALPRAEFKLIGKSRIAAEVDSKDYGRDVSNRAQVTIKIPF